MCLVILGGAELQKTILHKEETTTLQRTATFRVLCESHQRNVSFCPFCKHMKPSRTEPIRTANLARQFPPSVPCLGVAAHQTHQVGSRFVKRGMVCSICTKLQQDGINASRSAAENTCVHRSATMCDLMIRFMRCETIAMFCNRCFRN